ncbi:unnamed protein product [Phytophthora fragariaefolia]|uniref:Unnamed protein product n=1 Tax=Phytophthora fragariaefolia TaxID=1490495 RepID=A0A9W6Y579_9STRA|nr:unnamed protein product [Phytophthora fragariaefolia]
MIMIKDLSLVLITSVKPVLGTRGAEVAIGSSIWGKFLTRLGIVKSTRNVQSDSKSADLVPYLDTVALIVSTHPLFRIDTPFIFGLTQHRVKAILESESTWSLNRHKCQLQPRHSEEVRLNKYTKQAAMQTQPKLSVKVGGINRTSRTSVRVEDVEFRFDPDGSFVIFTRERTSASYPHPVPNSDLSRLNQISTLINLISGPN